MLRQAHAAGTRIAVATPHCFLPPWETSDPALLVHTFERLTEHLQRLQAEDERGEYNFLAEMSLRLGAENYISPEFFEALAKGQVVSLNRSRYVLIEFPPILPYEIALSAVDRILQTGRFPVIAHVERYPFCHRGTKRLARLVEMGCVAQINASTVVGASGRGLARLAAKLLDRGLVQVIASDCHDPHARPPDLGRAAEVLSRKRPAARVSPWLWENAARILEDKPLAR